MEQPLILGIRNKTNIDTINLLDDIADHIQAKVIYKHEVYKVRDIQDDGTFPVLLIKVNGLRSVYTSHIDPETSYVFDNRLIRITTNYQRHVCDTSSHVVMFVSLSVIDSRNVIKIVSCLGRTVINVDDFNDYDDVLEITINLIDDELVKMSNSGCVLS